MSITLKCTSITPHGDGTQTVSLSQAAAVTPRIMPPNMSQPGAQSGARIVGSGVPVKAPTGPIAVLLTNWPNQDTFSVGREYQVSVSPV